MKLNNKGFTLVELIVVIAILGVLAAVLAPQYIQYVEKSRVAVDKQTAATIEQAINTLCTDGTITAAETFTWDTTAGGIKSSLDSGSSTTNADPLTKITGAVAAAKSTAGKKASVVYTVAVDTSGIATVSVSPAYSTWGTTTATATATPTTSA